MTTILATPRPSIYLVPKQFFYHLVQAGNGKAVKSTFPDNVFKSESVSKELSLLSVVLSCLKKESVLISSKWRFMIGSKI